jgi:hypothetical protein
MKTPHLLISIFFLMLNVQAENLDVYFCESKSGDVEWGEHGEEDATTFLTFHRRGKKIGSLNLGSTLAKDFVKAALVYDIAKLDRLLDS